MAAKNDVTGDRIASKANSQAYRDGMGRIFGKKRKEPAMGISSEVPDGVTLKPIEGWDDAFDKVDEDGLVRISAGKMEVQHGDDNAG